MNLKKVSLIIVYSSNRTFVNRYTFLSNIMNICQKKGLLPFAQTKKQKNKNVDCHTQMEAANRLLCATVLVLFYKDKLYLLF